MSGQTLREKRALRLVHTLDQRLRCAEGQPFSERDQIRAMATTINGVAFFAALVITLLVVLALP